MEKKIDYIESLIERDIDKWNNIILDLERYIENHKESYGCGFRINGR